jgi:Domain of unknown function (DUF4331)
MKLTALLRGSRHRAPMPRAARRRRLGAAMAAIAVIAASAYALGPLGANASSHREAPLIAADPAVDNTDLYAFVSPERPDYVTFVADWQPFEEPNGGPNFYPFATDARYIIYVDNDGDAKPDATFRWTFQTIDKRDGTTFLYNNGPVTSIDDDNLLVHQTYMLETSFDNGPYVTRITGAPVAPSRVGVASMPNYQKLRDEATITFPGGWKGFAGQADDPFDVDLRVFDLLYGGDLSQVGQDTLAGFNVNTIALQVPFTDVALRGDPKRNPVIGVWSTTERRSVRMADGRSTGSWVQVSRLGQPLVNEVVMSADLKDAFNSLSPDKDATIPAVVKRVTDPEVPKLLQAIYHLNMPAAPRNDLVEIFLTGITTKANGPIKADLNSQLNNADVAPGSFQPSEMLRLNLSVPVTKDPNRLGVLAKDLQGFPNGRRLTDDVVDIGLQALAGAALNGTIVDALAAGDKVDANDQPFSDTFPYVALPNQAAVNAGAVHGPGAGVPSGTEPTAQPSAAHAWSTSTKVTVGAAAVVGLGMVAMLSWWWWRRRTDGTGPAGDIPAGDVPAVGH